MIIDKFISEKCIEYSGNFNQYHYQADVMTTTGKPKTIYRTTTISPVWLMGNPTELKPFVEVPQTSLQTNEDGL